MRKFYTTFLLAFVCISSAWAQQDTIKVSTAQEFYQAVENHGTDKNVVIKLIADIDADEYDGTKHFDMDFMATIDGYYTYVDSLGKVDPEPHRHMIKHHKSSHISEGSYIVSKLQNATIKGVTFFECTTSIWGSRTGTLLCYRAFESEITDVSFLGCKYESKDNDLYQGDFGFLASELHDCKVTSVWVVASTLSIDGSGSGLIAGKAWGTTFTDCKTDAISSIYSSSEPNAFIAGLVARTTDCKFDKCENNALVASSPMSDNLGGITAESTHTTFTDCFNGGTISQMSQMAYSTYRAESSKYGIEMLYNFGLDLSYRANEFFWSHPKALYKKTGFNLDSPLNMDYVQQELSEIRLIKFARLMTVIAVIQAIYDVAKFIYDQNAPDEVGGITSISYACTYERCTNAGFLVCRDAYCGGIVGYADTKDGKITNINKCINTGHIQSGEQSGGIVGYLKDSHATNCLNVGTVDCIKDTRGPIYGDTNAKGATITSCFALEHNAHYQDGTEGGEGVIIKFGIEDIFSGRAAYVMNRIAKTEDFRQIVGEDRYPSFTGNVVQTSDIRTDIDTHYKVHDARDFCFALGNQYANIILEDDIDFEGAYYSVFRASCKFHGSIDGKGHTIKNVKLDIEDHRNENFDEKNERHAMIQFAEGATFKNLTFYNLIVKHGIMVSGLVGNSKKCTYEDVHLNNSEIYAYNSWVGGLVYESDHDTFTRCTTDEKTSVSTHGIPNIELNAFAGGLVSQATGSTFTECVNGADVSGRLNVVGGIVAKDENSTFIRCINNGYVHHASESNKDDSSLGGIVAKAFNSNIYECINNGKLYCEEDWGGGIVGFGRNATILNCLNTSQELKFRATPSNCGGIIGDAEKTLVANCVSYADYPLIGHPLFINSASGNNYRLEINEHESSDWEMGMSAELMATGIVARWLNNGIENRRENKVVWNQTIYENGDNDKYPYPFAKGDYQQGVDAQEIYGCMHITSADQLVEFAQKVNNGNQFACAVLDSDIDLKGIDFKPIGTDKSRFRGIFNGQGHTIHGLNVKINSRADAAGLFGVAHTGAEIRNVILADDCTIENAEDGGAAGILGRFNIGWYWGSIIIENCASYATIRAKQHAGAMLGRVTTSDKDTNIKAYIDKCYNMGDIIVSNNGGAYMVGYAKNNVYMTNSWSAGKVMRADDKSPKQYASNPNEIEYFAGYEDKIYMENCYAIEPFEVGQNEHQIGVTKMQKDDLTNGHLTYRLNGFATEGDLRFYQKIGEDSIPMYKSRGGDIVYAYIMDNYEYYTNDGDRSMFYYFGPVRVKKDRSKALLDGDSKNSLKLINEVKVGSAELNRKFKANVPSTLMLPFSSEIGPENHVRLFTFDEMQTKTDKHGEVVDYTAVMKEVEDGMIDAYTPYLAMFEEDTDGMVFNHEVTMMPTQNAVTQRGDWYFVGQSNYRVISLDDFINEQRVFYGYTGMAYNGFKLGEFTILGEGASIAPFRCMLLFADKDSSPLEIDVVTKKAPARSAAGGVDDPISTLPKDVPLPRNFDVILKGANGETGIATFDNETGEFTFQGWYDLNGNRVDENYKGIRVNGNKKVIVK